MRARRSDSSIRCCVPIRRDRRRPERIQRRTVSGLQRARRAASGTVSMVVVYYNIVSRPGQPISFTAADSTAAWGNAACLGGAVDEPSVSPTIRGFTCHRVIEARGAPQHVGVRRPACRLRFSA